MPSSGVGAGVRTEYALQFDRQGRTQVGVGGDTLPPRKLCQIRCQRHGDAAWAALVAATAARTESLEPQPPVHVGEGQAPDQRLLRAVHQKRQLAGISSHAPQVDGHPSFGVEVVRAPRVRLDVGGCSHRFLFSQLFEGNSGCHSRGELILAAAHSATSLGDPNGYGR